MAQSDQSVQDATFPSVRADINDNLAALFSQSSGNSAPTVTVAFQPWVDTSSSPPVYKMRNGSNSAWITVGVLDPAGFQVGGITPIANGGTGAITAALALAALLPSQSGNAGKALVTDATTATWGTVAAGASIQVFTASGTYTPTAGKTTFLAFATGGGGGSGGSNGSTGTTGGGGGGGTAIRLYDTTTLGTTATVTVGGGGAGGSFFTFGGSNGGSGTSTVFTPSGTGLVITGSGGGGSNGNAGTLSSQTAGATGGGSTNSVFAINGQTGGSNSSKIAGTSFWGAQPGGGGLGIVGPSAAGTAGTAGVVFILEW